MKASVIVELVELILDKFQETDRYVHKHLVIMTAIRKTEFIIRNDWLDSGSIYVDLCDIDIVLNDEQQQTYDCAFELYMNNKKYPSKKRYSDFPGLHIPLI